jgi:hypothetical protein
MSSNLPATDTAELNRACDALSVAIGRRANGLRKSFTESAGYVATDAEVSQILARITRLSNEPK